MAVDARRISSDRRRVRARGLDERGIRQCQGGHGDALGSTATLEEPVGSVSAGNRREARRRRGAGRARAWRGRKPRGRRIRQERRRPAGTCGVHGCGSRRVIDARFRIPRRASSAERSRAPPSDGRITSTKRTVSCRDGRRQRRAEEADTKAEPGRPPDSGTARFALRVSQGREGARPTGGERRPAEPGAFVHHRRKCAPSLPAERAASARATASSGRTDGRAGAPTTSPPCSPAPPARRPPPPQREPDAANPDHRHGARLRLAPETPRCQPVGFRVERVVGEAFGHGQFHRLGQACSGGISLSKSGQRASAMPASNSPVAMSRSSSSAARARSAGSAPATCTRRFCSR